MKPLGTGNPHAGKPQKRIGPKYNRVIVVHTTENEVGSTAEQVAHWQNTQDRRFSGYHYLIDQHGWYLFGDPKYFRAYHAGESATFAEGSDHAGGGNDHIGISMVAYAHTWADTDNQADWQPILDNCSQLIAKLSEDFSIPIQRVSVDSYRQGKQGLLGHRDVATPAGRKSDPGEGFPWVSVLHNAHQTRQLKRSIKQARKEKPMKSDTDQFLDAAAEALKAGGATSNSLNYTVRFYRQLAKRAGVDGSKPEAVADWVYNFLKDLQNGKVDG